MTTSRLNQLMAFHAAQPGDPFLLFALAKEHEKMGDDATALQQFLQLKQQHPDYVGLYYHLGKLYERAGSAADAFAVYQEGMDVARMLHDQHALDELAAARRALDETE
ncbi:MAG: hypothetical protein RLY31_978 [Bacteroidota bacterium]|jgi:tetratricopeptide (TPR) repeat protein